ncbi:putative secreted protein [Insectomime virus]|uniref:Putative secreted protein n=1 Tax=Tunisvirus fontaine2 TaxID=1421067 RepID=V9SHC5_9VIRU|nr:putative secreted protein [Tunisvirus fontaine2]AHA46248.1 putative secreted protein [Insectomime virus]AHC55167.1 putative secreted protein [Tunisvirus fontaine2]
MLVLLLVTILVLSFLTLFCCHSNKESFNVWQVRVVKVKSPDASLPIKYGWWFAHQGTRNIPVTFVFEKPDGTPFYSFFSDLPLPDKASFLSDVEVSVLTVKIRDENRNILWSGQVRV